jgi:hypothetical protein
MGKKTIEISLRDGKLYYKDSEDNQGRYIQTHLNPEDEVVWELAKDSGIKELKNVEIDGTADFFEKQPTQVTPGQWNARVGNLSEGEVTYLFTYIGADGITATSSFMASSSVKTEDPPALLIP